MKFTKTHEKQLREFIHAMDENGCLPVTEWVSGSGRYTSRRALPCFVTRYEREGFKADARPAYGSPEREALEYLKANPRRKAVLVLDKSALADFLFNCARGCEIS